MSLYVHLLICSEASAELFTEILKLLLLVIIIIASLVSCNFEMVSDSEAGETVIARVESFGKNERIEKGTRKEWRSSF